MHGAEKKRSKLNIQKQSKDNIIKNIRILFKLKKENKSIKDRTIRDINWNATCMISYGVEIISCIISRLG